MTVYSSIPRAVAERTRARVLLRHKLTPEMVSKIAVKNSTARGMILPKVSGLAASGQLGEA